MQTTSLRLEKPVASRPMDDAVAEELAKRIEGIVAFAQANHIAAPDLLWNFSACVMANMHGEIRRAMVTRICLPLNGG